MAIVTITRVLTKYLYCKKVANIIINQQDVHDHSRRKFMHSTHHPHFNGYFNAEVYGMVLYTVLNILNMLFHSSLIFMSCTCIFFKLFLTSKRFQAFKIFIRIHEDKLWRALNLEGAGRGQIQAFKHSAWD